MMAAAKPVGACMTLNPPGLSDDGSRKTCIALSDSPSLRAGRDAGGGPLRRFAYTTKCPPEATSTTSTLCYRDGTDGLGFVSGGSPPGFVRRARRSSGEGGVRALPVRSEEHT